MNIYQRLLTGLKGFVMRYPTRMRSSTSLLLPNSGFDFRAAIGDGSTSSIIMACALFVARTFPEAPLRVQEIKAGASPQFVFRHTLETLIRRPNPFYAGNTLWMASIIDLILQGNFYWLKVRSATERVVELWWVPASMIKPAWDDNDNTVFISHYDYKPTGSTNDVYRIPVEDVVHVRYGLDPRNPRLGMAPLQAILREAFTDEEAANFTAALLRNLGIPGVIISPSDPDAEAVPGDLAEVKETFMRSFSGDKRGEPMVMRTKTDVKVLSFSPQQMDLRGLRRIPEERISAVIGLPAVVAGLGAGLDRSTFDNFKEAREAAFESLISPLYRMIAEEITHDLLPDFFTGDGVRGKQLECAFDLTQVRVLQEDENKRAERFGRLFERGVVKRSEARAALGMIYTDADEVYRLPKATLEIPAADGGVPYLTELLASSGGGFGDSGDE